MIKEQTRIDELASEIIADFETYRESGWRFILKLRDAVDQFSRLDPRRMEIYERVAQNINRSVKTLQNKVSVVRKPYSQLAYDNGLEFDHLLAVYHLPDEEAEALLVEAYENSLDASELGYIAKKHSTSIPENRNDTPTADAVDRMLSDDEPLSRNSIQYQSGGPVRDDDYDQQAEAYAEDGNGYDWTPELPPPADLARQIKAQYSADDIATLVAELVQIPY